MGYKSSLTSSVDWVTRKVDPRGFLPYCCKNVSIAVIISSSVMFVSLVSTIQHHPMSHTLAVLPVVSESVNHTLFLSNVIAMINSKLVSSTLYR